MKVTEISVQQRGVNALRRKYPTALVFHIPNGGRRNKREAVALKRMGVLAGVSDVFFIYNGALIALEFKAGAGKESGEQQAFGKAIKRHGFHYFAVRSATEALQAVEKTLSEQGVV